MATTESTPPAQDPEAELRESRDSYLKRIEELTEEVSAKHGRNAARLYLLLCWPTSYSDEQLAFILNIPRAKVAGLRGALAADLLIWKFSDPREFRGFVDKLLKKHGYDGLDSAEDEGGQQ